jgi:hypothetical protein
VAAKRQFDKDDASDAVSNCIVRRRPSAKFVTRATGLAWSSDFWKTGKRAFRRADGVAVVPFALLGP